MSEDADRVIEALQAGHDDLAPVVAGLTAEQLTGPSAASEWDLSQVLSHLGSGAEITLATLEAALAGAPTPGLDANRAVWARWDAMTPQQRADSFLAADLTLLDRYHCLDADTRASLMIDLGFLPQPLPLAAAARFRLNEFTLHSWDVRVAFDPAATLRPEATELLLDQVAFMLGWLAKPAARDAVLDVHLDAPQRRLGLRIGQSAAVTDPPTEPDCVLSAPAEAWLRLVSGRLAPEHTPASVTLTGEVSLDDLRRVFPGY
jgi:uncharacterized protein (TIGR03083 family)